ncbi:MAG TPA: hypothetical protein VE077_00620 [Candidatus Methylomirabilis sp.]|nr:hypothetical protein [Candidatus Methylomirabilis sp.]
MNDRVRVPSSRGMSVKDDWCAWLPREKDEVFRAYVQQLDVGYNMLSVSLDEVLSLRQNGLFAKAGEAVSVTADLCGRFTNSLAALLWSLAEHAKHHGIVPNAAPLDPTNFQGARGQRAARFSALFCRILLSERFQFLHKISTLGEMVADLSHDFCSAAADIAEIRYLAPDTIWRTIDTSHYDLNTCLREAIVLLKSFLLALPNNELAIFQATVCAQMSVSLPKKDSLAQRLIRHRRMAPIGGE